MIPAERHQQLLKVLQGQCFISIAALAQSLNVSEMTVRRDVAELSSRGKLLVVRGGVKSLAPPLGNTLTTAENRVLLHAALSYLEESRVIFLDCGLICRQLAQLIPWSSKMTVVTNDFTIACDIIRQTKAQLVFIGGELNRNDNSCGKSLAMESLGRLSFDLLFLSPGSWNENGIWHHDEYRQEWYSCLMAGSRRKVLLAQEGNYDQGGLFKLYSLSELDMVLSDYPSIERLLSGRVDPLTLHPLRNASKK
ncbi:DeoR/GlpR family DNA-binding transcription regulator [Pantoea coffeiphila]|uniref:DeoR/GlpR family DNA-binding transcription regulator n=1 Tax=Pantoea coffeiphila TaxID=1465635 RepID=UPI0019606C43|nr:DeoR/GlpR family DNA-binding transcription regulator [Pantoea coffeiphila]MBM7344856.1 DeoR/GlpR family transcriptional regulator of sugar metabolism [Pantoea coffeiphila]